MSCALARHDRSGHGTEYNGTKHTEGLQLLVRAVVHGANLDRAQERQYFRLSSFFRRRRFSLRCLEVVGKVLPPSLEGASCWFQHRRGIPVLGRTAQSEILDEYGQVFNTRSDAPSYPSVTGDLSCRYPSGV